jgi:hypothetical protein
MNASYILVGNLPTFIGELFCRTKILLKINVLQSSDKNTFLFFRLEIYPNLSSQPQRQPLALSREQLEG